MKLPKHQMKTAIFDLKELALSRASELSLDHIKGFSPETTTSEKTAYLAGKVAGVVEFLFWADRELDRLYKLEDSREE